VGNVTAIKVEGLIFHNIQDVCKLISNPAIRSEFDPMFDSWEFKYHVGEKTWLGYSKFTLKSSLASSRDFFGIFHIQEERNGDIYVVNASIDHFGTFFPDPNCVRGTIYNAGWCLKKISKDETYVSYFSHIEFGGKIPYWMVRLGGYDCSY
jgi:hypothetical protein